MVVSNLKGNKRYLFLNNEWGIDKKGLRVRFAFTLNSIDMMAATYMSVTNITKKGYPNQSAHLVYT